MAATPYDVAEAFMGVPCYPLTGYRLRDNVVSGPAPSIRDTQ